MARARSVSALPRAVRAGSRSVIVGWHGSGGSRAALRWAAEHAERIGAPLEVVGEAGDVLRHDAARAAMLVLGAHDGDGPADTLLGAIADRLLDETACPLTVVRGDASRAGPVVVGVDGSPACRPALEHALDDGLRRSAGVVAVSGVLPPGWVADPLSVSEAATVGLIDAVRSGTTAFVERVVTDRRRGDRPSAPFEVRVRALAAVESILQTTEEADAGLAVVGHRRGGERGRVLRSVARGLLTCSPCPVTVIPADRVPEVHR